MTTKRQRRMQGADTRNGLLPLYYEDSNRREAPRKKPLPPLKAQTDNQLRYIKTINSQTITFGLGPAGTGKTYIATRLAAEAFKNGDIEKLVISRPSIEAGESIGFLPGDQGEKIDPFFIPVKEVLIKVLGAGPFDYAYKNGQIEFVPIGFMRGRTFEDAWVIIDEAQNTTPLQMKMVLSRLGQGSKYIVNGDVRQSDIPGMNGLADAATKLRNVPGIHFINFTRDDIVRHGMVREIIEAYEGPYQDEAANDELPDFITRGLTVEIDAI